jgi:hypothetical protein
MECQTPGGAWTPVRPAGVLYSYAEYHLALAPAFKDEVPYAVGLIELDDGPRMYGALVGLARTEDIGRRVHAVFDAVTPEVTLVKWQLTGPNDRGAPRSSGAGIIPGQDQKWKRQDSHGV